MRATVNGDSYLAPIGARSASIVGLNTDSNVFDAGSKHAIGAEGIGSDQIAVT